jgi:hypothetical protein
MLNRYIHIFAISLLVTVIVGVATYRALPSWELLISDVGNEGAWTVSILFHLIYGVCVGIGNIIACLSQNISSAPYKSVIVASSITVILLDTLLSIFAPVFENILLFCLLLSVCGFVICSVTLIVDKMHIKSSNLTGANSAPPS